VRVTLIRGRAIDSAVNKIAKALSQNGYEVKLLVWDRQNTLKIENDEGYTIHRFNFKAPYDKLTSVFYYPIWWAYILFFLMREKCDVIHACDLDTLIPAVPAKLLKRVKLCYIIYDFYAGNIPIKIPNIVRNFVAFIEKYGIRFVDVLFLVDKSRYEQVRGAKINQIEYIYNSPADCFDSSPKLKPISKKSTSLFYAGSLHESRGLEKMINAVRELEGINLTIAGIGPNEDIIKNNSLKLHNIHYLGWIPYEEVIANNLDADILFAFYDPNISNNRYASPNKLFEAMMCGKPILMNEGTTAAEIVKKEDCGLVVPYGDVGAIKDAILKLKNDAILCDRLGKNGRRAYEEKYNWSIMEERLLKSYREL